MVQNVKIYDQPGSVVTDRGIVDPNYVEGRTHGHGGLHVHWGSVFAGIFIALGTLALLSAFGAAIGASAYDPYNGDGRGYALGAGVWALLSALIAFGVGGFIAARTSGHTDRRNGLFHGLMVWAVAIPLLAFVVGSGITRVGTARTELTPNPMRVDPDRRDVTVEDAKKAAMKAAWGAFASLLLGLAAATVGGHIGARGLPRVEDLKPHTHTA